MNLSTEREENSDLMSKVSNLMDANLSLQKENRDLKRSLENLQIKYKTNICELEQTIDSLRNQNLSQSEFYFENAPEERSKATSNTILSKQARNNGPQSINSKENLEHLLSKRLQNAEKEIQRLQKLLADQKAKESNENQKSTNNELQDESKYFSLLKSENQRLKKLVDQKDLELTKAETTIAEQKLEISQLTLLQKESNEPTQVENIDISHHSESNSQNIENALETFEHIFEDEINRISELSDQRNRLFDIIKKFEKISLLESSINSKTIEDLKSDQIKKIESETKEKVLEELFKRIITAIQVKNNNFDDIFDEDEEIYSYEDKIVQLFQNISSQKVEEKQKNNNSPQIERKVNLTVHNDLSESEESGKTASFEDLDTNEILLGQLKNSMEFIRSFLKSKNFNKDSIIEKCSEIDNFLKKQKPVPKIVTLFTNEPSISEQMKTFIQIRNNANSKIESLSKSQNLDEIAGEYKEMIKILNNLFKAVLTVNSLLFENVNELARMYQKVSQEKDSLQIKSEMIEKNCDERLSYISSKLSTFLLKVESNSPSSQTQKQEENQSPISPDFIEEGIEKLCQQNIDLKLALKEKNSLLKKMKQKTNKIVETRKVDQTENTEYRKKVTMLENQLAKMNQKYQQMKEKDDQLISQLRVDLDEALVALKNGDRLEKELEEQKAKVTKMKEKKESYDKLNNQIRELTTENNELKLQLKAKETQIQRLTANAESNLSQIQNLTEKVRKLKDKKNLIKKENEQLLNKNRTEVGELRTRNAKLESDMKNSFETLITENNQLKEKVEQMTVEISSIEELKNSTAQKVAQANLQSKNASLKLLECQNALKVNKDVAEQQIYSMKSSFEFELKKLKDEIERCRKRFIFAFQIDNININKYLNKSNNDISQVSLFELVNAFISFYEPQKIHDYDKCLNFFKLNYEEKIDKPNSPLYSRCRSIMKNLSEANNTLSLKKKELNHVSLEIDDLSHQLNQNKNDSNLYKSLKKRLISLYIKMKKGQVPQNSANLDEIPSKLALNCHSNFELDSKEFDKVMNEIEEMIYINFLKPSCLQFKLDLMRAEKTILTDERIRKLVSIESIGDVINSSQRNNEKVRSLRPISIVVLFARRVCELSGFSHFYYIQNNPENDKK